MAPIAACFCLATGSGIPGDGQAGLSTVRALKVGTSVAAEPLGRQRFGVVAGKTRRHRRHARQSDRRHWSYRQGGFRDGGWRRFW